MRVQRTRIKQLRAQKKSKKYTVQYKLMFIQL